jgi:hypothetical protein
MADLVDPDRMEGLDPAMNDPELLDALALKGIKIDPKTGKKLIPEVLNRKTVVQMKMQGRHISEEQMFRRVQIVSPLNAVRYVGLRDGRIKAKVD